MAAAIPHGQAHGFLFSDLRDYTRYVEAHGDLAAAELLSRYRGIVREAVARFEGAEIRTEGDSFYVVFPSASAAVRCGLAILEAIASVSESGSEIRVGIGVHAGETVETAEGLVGSAVNIAARVCSQAAAGELLVTDTVRSLTRTVLPFRFVARGTRKLKGIDESISLYRVEPVEVGVVIRPSVQARPGRVYLGGAAIRGSRVVVLTLVVLAIVALGVGAVLGLNPLGGGLHSGPADSSPAGSPPLAGSASSADAQTPTARPTYPTAAGADLLSRLPINVRGTNDANCAQAPEADVAANAVVSIRCTLDPATADAAFVIYDEFAAEAPMAQDFNDLEAAHRLVQGDCSKQPVGWLPWAQAGFTGKLACYADAGDHAWVAWTYDGSFILARASRPDDQWHKLYVWWVEAAAFMVR